MLSKQWLKSHNSSRLCKETKEKNIDVKATKGKNKHKPKEIITLIQQIITLSLEGRDIPETEKHCLVTALPKAKSYITSFNDSRPITVGPIMGRLINKLIAQRLAEVIVRKGYMDPAQFAFLPGKSIHEPISTAIHAYEQSNRAKNGEKALYAIFMTYLRPMTARDGPA